MLHNTYMYKGHSCVKLRCEKTVSIIWSPYTPLIKFNNWYSFKFIRINCYNLQLATTVFGIVGNTKFGTGGYIIRNR